MILLYYAYAKSNKWSTVRGCSIKIQIVTLSSVLAAGG